VRGPLQPSVTSRSTGQDLFILLQCCCSNRGHTMEFYFVMMLNTSFLDDFGDVGNI
jgi:hypothetical protein